MTDYAIREDQGNIAIVTLNRPDKLNAINAWMRAFIRDAVYDLRDRDDLRVLLIRARGRYFTAGVDLHELGMTSGEPDKRGQMEFRRDYRMNFHLLHDEIEACEKPVVMAIQGPCLGLGVEMGGSCDFRLASEDAAFGLPEIDLGVIAGSGGVSRFTRLCGIGWSKWLSVAGERIDADTARIAGFVQAVYPREGFEEKVLEFCRRLAGRPAEAQGAAKLAVELAWDLDRTQARNVERLVNTPLMLRDNREHVKRAFGKKPKT